MSRRKPWGMIALLAIAAMILAGSLLLGGCGYLEEFRTGMKQIRTEIGQARVTLDAARQEVQTSAALSGETKQEVVRLYETTDRVLDTAGGTADQIDELIANGIATRDAGIELIDAAQQMSPLGLVLAAGGLMQQWSRRRRAEHAGRRAVLGARSIVRSIEDAKSDQPEAWNNLKRAINRNGGAALVEWAKGTNTDPELDRLAAK